MNRPFQKRLAVTVRLLTRLGLRGPGKVGFACLLACATAGLAWGGQRPLALVPAEVASKHYIVTINGQTTPVMHAALNLYFLNFEAGRHTTIAVTADTDGFWDKGVEIQPWRLGIRPRRNGRTITFTLDGPAKITISRPNDFLAKADMLYLFSNSPQQDAPVAPRPGLRYIGPGVHIQNIDAASGDNIYLAPGAVVFGSLNVWGVDRVRVFGPGVIVYDGTQNPADDDGWMHKPNWHCIVMDNAHDIAISDITCVVRSRTWQIQMKDSRRIVYDNIKVIGANDANANADGMDWLGGGDTLVRNSFFRAADDVFAMQTSWEGYGPKAFAVQGSPVTNVVVENSVVSTSISNVVRAAWPQKNFEGGNFSMRNTDILHTGLGGCGTPFALMELWANPDGRGRSADYTFKDIRMEDWYSLVNVQQTTPVQGVHFTDIAALTQPPLVPSILKGSVTGVTVDNMVIAGTLVDSASALPADIMDGAAPVIVANTGPAVSVSAPRGWLRPGETLRFAVNPTTAPRGLHYEWIFGDGTEKAGRSVKHRFHDADGTLLDGSGLYRVLLHVSSDTGRNTWVSVPTVVRTTQIPALVSSVGTSGVAYEVTGAGQAALPQAATGRVSSLSLAQVPHPLSDYAVAFSAYVNVPDDGGYVFTVIGNGAGSLEVDGSKLGFAPEPLPQVCGLPGNAARVFAVPVELAKGLHHLRITDPHGTGIDDFQVLWQGPGIPLSPIPASRFMQ